MIYLSYPDTLLRTPLQIAPDVQVGGGRLLAQEEQLRSCWATQLCTWHLPISLCEPRCHATPPYPTSPQAGSSTSILYEAELPQALLCAPNTITIINQQRGKFPSDDLRQVVYAPGEHVRPGRADNGTWAGAGAL